MKDSLHILGERYLDFRVTHVVEIEELQATLCELVHEPSGALVMHIAAEDPENLFCLSFKTPPHDSSGAPHILEHVVLCGSRKYPVKDPFFSMGRRSLNTFMNAMTGADFTCYPAASQVEKDFYNLLDVYLDAVFHPLLREESFLQEGYRFGFVKPQDPLSGPVCKGVVYNEMKGVFASVDARMWQLLLSALVPDLSYAYVSGGDPKEIARFTYSDLIKFYESYYHPSRCLFFFYGNLPLKKHLDFIHDRTLQGVVGQKLSPQSQLQHRFSSPVRVAAPYPVESQEGVGDRDIYVFGWLTAPLIEEAEVLALSVLEIVLMDTDVSILKKALLDSKLCTQVQAHMDIEMTEVPFAIVCKGCAHGIEKQLHACIIDTIEHIVQEGIAEDMVESAIHQLEFARTEVHGEGAPFGLTLFMRSALAKQHGCVPEKHLQIHGLFNELRNHIARHPRYLLELLEKHFLSNPHAVFLHMYPDAELLVREAAEEESGLAARYASLKESDIATILRQTSQLEIYQDEVENQDLECLPKVLLSDVDQHAYTPVVVEKNLFEVKTFQYVGFTNKVLYADLFFDIPQMPLDDFPYLSLLGTCLSEIGSGNKDYGERLRWTQRYTGGIGATCGLHLYVQGGGRPYLHIRGKALERHTDQLFILFEEMVRAPHWDDTARVRDLVLQLHTALRGRLARSGMRYATQRALSRLSQPAYAQEKLQGLPYFQKVEEITSDLELSIPALASKLASLHRNITSFQSPHLVISGDDDLYTKLHPLDCDFSRKLDVKQAPWTWESTVPELCTQAHIIASPVAFTVFALHGVLYEHMYAPALSLGTFLLENKVLLSRIREQGGAYGCGASFQPTSGQFYLYSYRDPHIMGTWDVFKYAIQEIASGRFTEEDLQEAKLGMIQHLDTPIAPGMKACLAYSWMQEGKTSAMRQTYRDRLLAMTISTIQEAFTQVLLPQIDKAPLVTCSGKDILDKERFPYPIFKI